MSIITHSDHNGRPKALRYEVSGVRAFGICSMHPSFTTSFYENAKLQDEAE